MSAQDTLIKVNGVVAAVKILEISSAEIRYKKADFPDGPTYVENKSGIKTIIFSNGTREEITVPVQPAPAITIQQAPPETGGDYYSGPVTPKYKIQAYGNRYVYNNRTISERELHRVLQDTKDKELLALVQDSKDAHKMKFIGFGAIPLGIASLVVFSNSYSTRAAKFSSGKLATSGLLLCGAIACPIISGIYSHRRTAYNRIAIKVYNQKY